MRMRSTKACFLLLGLQLLITGVRLEEANDWPESELELELQRQPDKLAYCRALQRLQLQQYEQTSCLNILEDELTMTGELLMDSPRRCWWGWELFVPFGGAINASYAVNHLTNNSNDDVVHRQQQWEIRGNYLGAGNATRA
ncbi:hypothetical protein AWZ03_007114 [Drosophila navojoa]|uniref:Uncharacterized protein n=1 Tax=Drosophila navojoa TaxID=7232 RepID=A0A484BCK7_DRONA|nr:hypothetical protein AWZ03_007114 [Drosophila navojoa]